MARSEGSRSPDRLRKLDVRRAARVKIPVFKFLLVDNKKIKNDVSSTADTVLR